MMARTLLSAVKSRNVALAKTILSKRLYGNIDHQDPRQDGTALFWACSQGLTELVHLLIFHGANLDACTVWNATPLHASADNNRLDDARLLVKLGADVNKKTIYGDTPCHLAAYRGHQQMVQLLVELGEVDLNLTNSKKRTSLDESILGCHPQVTNYLCHVMSQKYSIPIELSDHLMTEMSLDLTEVNNSLGEPGENSYPSKETFSCSPCSIEDQSTKVKEILEPVSPTTNSSSKEDNNNTECSLSIHPSSIFSVAFPPNFDENRYRLSSHPVSPMTHSSCTSPELLDNDELFLNDLSSSSSSSSDPMSNMNFMNIFTIPC